MLGRRTSVVLLVVVVLGSQPVLALVIDPGRNFVPANTVVDLPILIFGWDEIAAVGLYVQIGDGGPTIGGTASHPGTPIITDVSLTAPGTIFGDNNWGQFGSSTGLGHSYPDFIGFENTQAPTRTMGSLGGNTGRGRI